MSLIHSAKNACKVLGISSNFTADEILTANQQLIQQYHPDRIAGMGPELGELAEARTTND